MRVAFVSMGDPRDVRNWSGIPYFVLREVTRQVDHVEVILPLSRHFRWLFLPSWLIGKLTGHPIQMDRHPIALRSYARQIKRQLEHARSDAIISMSTVPIAALKTDIPVAFWTDAVLEGMVDYYPGSFTRMSRTERAIGHRQEQAALSRAACAAYSSRWAVECVRRNYQIADDNLHVIEFGANLDIDHGRADIEALIQQRLSRPINLLFIGVDWHRKGGDLALEITRELNAMGYNATLRVVGCASPPSPWIENLGFIDKTSPAGQETLKQLLREATFFLLPTLAEAAGIVFAEASAFGLPIYARDTGGVTSYVRSGENGYAMPDDAEASAYARSIASVMRDGEMYGKLALGAFDLYARSLNWQTGVAKLLRLIAPSDQQPLPPAMREGERLS